MNEVWSAQLPVSSDTSLTTHMYVITWTPELIRWSIDGVVARTQLKNETFEAANTGDQLPYDHHHYPNTPLTVNFGVWNYQGRQWANGPIDWTKQAGPLTAKLLSLKVTCYNGPIPLETDPQTVPNAPDVLETTHIIQKPLSADSFFHTTTADILSATASTILSATINTSSPPSITAISIASNSTFPSSPVPLIGSMGISTPQSSSWASSDASTSSALAPDNGGNTANTTLKYSALPVAIYVSSTSRLQMMGGLAFCAALLM
ncbi:hypothetical protein BC830DRAFT_1138783 [Chytriomyces sp. MP71]|nr:hypothetical protein BC830DRAFT_1138783 [Chytriomyces sp. MP71]